MAKNEYKYTSILFTMQLLIEFVDTLEDSPLWKQKVKLLSNQLRSELIRVVDAEFPGLMGFEHEKSVVVVAKAQEQLMDRLAEISPNDYPVINLMLEMYDENPEEMCNKLEIQTTYVD